ncbi:MAG TPA: beta-ketoacyl-ACP reductase [Nocardioidaceae bacterium]|jgi:NAD(P)-dependent dehydrogenase (short-subunit alcohol dehydrogenase family)|nr:beta-ketoacyl-ACP reductase [Nocardioidaceae bacterium]
MTVLDPSPDERSSVMAGSKLAGRVALVTGGTRGIGAAICRSLASQGASVAAGYSGNTQRAEEFLKQFEADFGGESRATLHQGNVSHPEDCRRTVEEVLDQHGRLDILVNNAGITIDKMAMQMSVEDWNTVLAVNLSGSFYMAQPALEHMVERGTGRIVFVSSVIGETGNIGQANYAASKAGMLGLTKTLAKEAAFILKKNGKLDEDSIGITVNTVTPGFVATEMVEKMPEKVLARVTAQIPVNRLCRPEEIARVVHFLAADSSAYITGQVWGVNGGMDM